MPAEDFITFQVFNDAVAAHELATVFKENAIEFELVNNAINFDPFFTNNELAKEFRVKIRQQDFEKADELLQQISLNQLDSVAKDYYLFEFTDEELLDVVEKKDEWGHLNFMLAQKILKERGKEVKPAEIELFKEQRIEELTKPEESQKGLVNAGYIFALLGGVLGIFIGWHLASHKKRLPNGERIHGYTVEDRKHGSNIVFLGFFSMLIWLVVKFGDFK